MAARYKAVEGNVTTVAHGSVSEASAESCPGTVLLTNNDNERPCPREHLSYKERAERAEEVQKRSFCRRFWVLLSLMTKVPRRRHSRPQARGEINNYPRPAAGDVSFLFWVPFLLSTAGLCVIIPTGINTNEEVL